MTRRRTDLVSESVDKMPRWLRGPVRFQLGLMKVVRVFIALQAIGGLVGLCIGAVTLNGKLAVGGLAQMTVAGLFFGLSIGSEQVLEAKGPNGAYVVRTASHRLWRDAHGFRRMTLLVMGDRVWAASVRRREDDPFGAVVIRRTAETEREAVVEAHALVDRIKKGDELVAS